MEKTKLDFYKEKDAEYKGKDANIMVDFPDIYEIAPSMSGYPVKNYKLNFIHLEMEEVK